MGPSKAWLCCVPAFELKENRAVSQSHLRAHFLVFPTLDTQTETIPLLLKALLHDGACPPLKPQSANRSLPFAASILVQRHPTSRSKSCDNGTSGYLGAQDNMGATKPRKPQAVQHSNRSPGGLGWEWGSAGSFLAWWEPSPGSIHSIL